ncbi:MAG: hypothetical protein ACXACY_02085 [Candidatus Hodarchaeales archaeon]
MILERYWELLRKIYILYGDGKYTEIIDYFETTDIEFPYGKAALYYSWICAATKLGQFEEAIQILKQLIDEGGWYSEHILTQSPSLDPLQDIPEFKDQKEDLNVTVIPEEFKPPYPLMLALHADSGVIEEEIKFWKSMTDKGYILGMPRSTNVYWSGKDSAYWPDHETAGKQIKSYIQEIKEKNSINLDQIIVGGLSSGAALAIWLALSKTIPVRKFVAVSPGGQWMNEVERYQSLIDNLYPHELSGIIIQGKEDKVVSQENIRTFVKMLTDAGISCELYEPPNVGHWYSPDFTNRLSSFL